MPAITVSNFSDRNLTTPTLLACNKKKLQDNVLRFSVEHDVKSLCCLPVLLVTLVLFGLLQYKERLEREKFLKDLQKRIVNCPVGLVFCS